MIRALIFDFNGVIADDETPHIACFRQALSEFGLSLTAEDYYGAYLGMDERTCAALLLTARDGQADDVLLGKITARKTDLFRAYTARRRPALFPGVVEFVKAGLDRYRMAIASGGRRHQIHEALAGTAIEQDFEAIVAAEDCSIGKPDPAIYRMTVARLNANRPGRPPFAPSECLVFEDSVAGIRAAHDAGMNVLAVSTTYPREKLHEADGILASFDGTSPEAVIGMLVKSR
ncbi:MAG TPA: HAD family phosphatase [Nitrospira sp.]|nr:HAD family phosphatase [Nitrospira sp.]